MKEIHNEKSRSEYFTFTPLSDTRDEGCTHASSPSQSWTKSVFNSYEEAFVDFRQFWLKYGTIKRDDINWQVVCSNFNNLRNHKWDLNTGSVLSHLPYISEASNWLVDKWNLLL